MRGSLGQKRATADMSKLVKSAQIPSSTWCVYKTASDRNLTLRCCIFHIRESARDTERERESAIRLDRDRFISAGNFFGVENMDGMWRFTKPDHRGKTSAMRQRRRRRNRIATPTDWRVVTRGIFNRHRGRNFVIVVIPAPRTRNRRSVLCAISSRRFSADKNVHCDVKLLM